ncbi:Exocyst complex component 2 [Sarcoptes scabiei]|nr:Exocyst complex component 2 [Sarcoptes scabiei]
MSLVPKVTGISPKEGPPRTKLTIRGENLGINQFDLISVKICDIECLIFTEWITPQKIITKSPNCLETGPVIITTRSGGIGHSTIKFRALEQKIGLTTPSGVWIDESEIFPFDSTTSSLITNSPDGPMKIGHGFSNDILSETFNPSMYLVENHSQSSFEDLKTIYRNQLNKSKNESSNALDSNTFLKANIVSIMDCLNALNALYLSFKKDRQEFGSDMTQKIDENIRSANESAHEIFDSIIVRKDKADSTRNALNVLQRYRFLFNLPSNIDRNMQRKEYDVVINDFFRAKNLFADSSVTVFRKVFLEVEERIHTFICNLRESFRECALSMENNNIDELKKLIKYLSILVEDSDPAWESIILIKDSLSQKITKLYEEFKNSLENSTDLSESSENIDSPQKPPQAIFIDETTRIFSRIFIDLFKLGCAYLNKDLHNKSSIDELKRKREILEKDIFSQSIQLLSTHYKNVFFPNESKSQQQQQTRVAQSKNKNRITRDDLIVWLPYCLRCSVNCYTNLSKLDYNQIHIDSVSLLEPVKKFIFDLRIHTLTKVLQDKSEEIKNLHQKEIWAIQFDDIYGVRTNLPLQFETQVIDILQLVRDSVIQVRTPDEIDIFSQINVKGLVKQLVQSLIMSFLYALERSSSNSIPNGLHLAEDNRSLVILCNCSYTANYVLPKLYEMLEKYNYPDMSQVIQLTQRKFKEKENQLLEAFIDKKRDEVIGGIETSMQFFDENWYLEKEMPKDVSYYIKEIIMNLIYVQSEIYRITPQLVYKTMFEILIATINEIGRLCAIYSKKLSDAARIQMLIDINAIEHVFKRTGNKFNQILKSKIQKCREWCNISLEDETIQKLIDDVTNSFSKSMRLQVCCFDFNNEF